MPFTRATLKLMASGAGNQIWHYTTNDAAAAVDTTGYFNDMLGLMNVGDIIFRITLSSGALATAGIHVVRTASTTAIDVTDTTVLVVTNTD